MSFWFRRKGLRQEDLLRAMSRIAPIRVVGSRPPRPMQPGSPDCAAEWLVAASRSSFGRPSEGRAGWLPSRRCLAVWDAVTRIAPPVSEERVRARWTESGKKALEIVLHASDGAEDRHIVEGFWRYLRDLGIRPHPDRVLFAGGLAFLSLDADAHQALEVVRFALVRVVREMPRLRVRRTNPPGSGDLRSVSPFGVPSRAHPTEDAAPHLLALPPTPTGGCRYA